MAKKKDKKAAVKKRTSKGSGRHTQFTQQKADFICKRIATSIIGLHRLHEKDPENFPDPSTILDWLRDNESFALQYARAKEHQADFLVEEMLTVAYDGSQDLLREKLVVNADGMKMVLQESNKEFVQRSRLKVDTLKFIAMKLKPKVYGEQRPTVDAEKETVIRIVEDKDE